MTVFDGDWWFLSLPPKWRSIKEAHGASFYRTPKFGSLQISAAQNEAADVSDEELREFAAESLDKGSRIRSIRVGHLVGLVGHRVEGEIALTEWWLRQGRVLMYITYAAPFGIEESEKEEVGSIIESLTVRASVSDR